MEDTKRRVELILYTKTGEIDRIINGDYMVGVIKTGDNEKMLSMEAITFGSATIFDDLSAIYSMQVIAKEIGKEYKGFDKIKKRYDKQVRMKSFTEAD